MLKNWQALGLMNASSFGLCRGFLKYILLGASLTSSLKEIGGREKVLYSDSYAWKGGSWLGLCVEFWELIWEKRSLGGGGPHIGMEMSPVSMF